MAKDARLRALSLRASQGSLEGGEWVREFESSPPHHSSGASEMKTKLVGKKGNKPVSRSGKCFENYPMKTVAISNLVSISIYLIGSYIIYQIGALWLIAYVAYIAFLEIRLLRNCAECYYYGRLCAFGQGRLSSAIFKKGNPKNFSQRKIAWKDILPDFMVSIIPMLVGIWLLIMRFNFLLLAMIVVLFLLTSAGNGFVRGSLACNHCKQRELGCPAERLFKR